MNTAQEKARALAQVALYAVDDADRRLLEDALFAEGRERPARKTMSSGGPNSRRLEHTPDACGTPRGHAQHRYHHEPICDRCREAHRLEMRERRALAGSPQ